MPQFNKYFVITQIINVLREKLESMDIKLGKILFYIDIIWKDSAHTCKSLWNSILRLKYNQIREWT